MTKQEALDEFKCCLWYMNWTGKDCVDGVPKEAIEIAIKALEKSEFTPGGVRGYQPPKGNSKPPAPTTSDRNSVKPD